MILFLPYVRRKNVSRLKNISEETKGVLEIFIHELEEVNDLTRIREIIDSWIKGNDLHPEQVQTFVVDDEETNPEYLDGLWMACVSWARDVEDESNDWELKAISAHQAVKRILSLEAIAERHDSRITISLEKVDKI